MGLFYRRTSFNSTFNFWTSERQMEKLKARLGNWWLLSIFCTFMLSNYSWHQKNTNNLQTYNKFPEKNQQFKMKTVIGKLIRRGSLLQLGKQNRLLGFRFKSSTTCIILLFFHSWLMLRVFWTFYGRQRPLKDTELLATGKWVFPIQKN